MSSGKKRLVFNNEERIISADHNRQQNFRDKMDAEFLRALFNTFHAYDDIDAAAVAIPNTGLSTPVSAEILDGLMVQPQPASSSVLVSPGRAMFLNPDGGVDDSDYKFVDDPGVSTIGTLTIPPNGGAAPVISVIECSWSETTTETDNRDIFNPVTGTFSAALVTKAREGRLSYRVRTGTVGGGFASVGVAQGWLPLAVASMKAGGTTTDDAIFWDVRPLLTDRIHPPFNIKRFWSKGVRAFGHAFVSPTNTFLSGDFDVTGVHVSGGRRLGGRLRPGGAAADADQIDLRAADNQATGQVPGGNAFYYVYLVTPNGLPRWARYWAPGQPRFPRSPRGIPVYTSVPPNRDGTPSAAINLPASCGLDPGIIPNFSAVLIACGRTNGAGVPQALTIDGSMQLSQIGPPAFNASSVGVSTATFTLSDNVRVPAGAKAILATISITEAAGSLPANSAVTNTVVLSVKDASGNTVGSQIVHVTTLANPTAAPMTPFWGFTARIPIVPDYPNSSPATRDIVLTWSSGLGVPASTTMQIHGWDFGRAE